MPFLIRIFFILLLKIEYFEKYTLPVETKNRYDILESIVLKLNLLMFGDFSKKKNLARITWFLFKGK